MPRGRECIWGLYAILDVNQAGKSHVDVAAAVISGGARVIQLRDKTTPFEELLEVGRELRKLTRTHDVVLIVNDNPYLAREIEADGVHLGQTDMPVDLAREIIGHDKIVGLSTHTKQQALAAQMLPVDYIGVGPVYETATKKSEWNVVGTPLVRWIRKNVNLPIVAIGGITSERVVDVVAAGAHNVAMVRELMIADDIELRTRGIVEAIRLAAAEEVIE